MELRLSHALPAALPLVAAGAAGGPQAPATMLSVLMLSAFLLGGLLQNSAGAVTLATPSRSTTIALTSDETRLVVINREANSVSIIQVKDAQGTDVANKLAEIAVGLEPRCVAIHPNDPVAYVTNGLSGTVSVVDLVLGRVVAEIRVGTEPRGCALTPNGYAALCGEPYGGNSIHRHHEQSARTRSSTGLCQLDAIPPPLRSPMTVTTTTRTKQSSSPRSSPNSTPTSSTPSTLVVRCAISGNEGSSTPSRRAMPIRRSPKSPSPRSPIPALTPAARTSARAPTPPTSPTGLLPATGLTCN